MNAVDRTRIRQAIDQRARTRTAMPAVARGCNKCGIHLDLKMPGCDTCARRHLRRAYVRRNNPAVTETHTRGHQ